MTISHYLSTESSGARGFFQSKLSLSSYPMNIFTQCIICFTFQDHSQNSTVTQPKTLATHTVPKNKTKPPHKSIFLLRVIYETSYDRRLDKGQSACIKIQLTQQSNSDPAPLIRLPPPATKASSGISGDLLKMTDPRS